MIIDLMCDDYKRAARNRRMVKLKQNIIGYLWIEAVIRSWPYRKPLPEWLLGSLPVIGKHEEREMYEYGIYEV